MYVIRLSHSDTLGTINGVRKNNAALRALCPAPLVWPLPAPPATGPAAPALAPGALLQGPLAPVPAGSTSERHGEVSELDTPKPPW